MSFVWHSVCSFQDKLQSMIIPRYLQLSTLDIFLPLTFNWKSGWFFLSLLKTQKHVLSTLRLSLLAINHLGICCKQVLALSNRVQRFFSYKNNCNKGTWQTDGYTTTAIPIPLAYRRAVKKNPTAAPWTQTRSIPKRDRYFVGDYAVTAVIRRAPYSESGSESSVRTTNRAHNSDKY